MAKGRRGSPRVQKPVNLALTRSNCSGNQAIVSPVGFSMLGTPNMEPVNNGNTSQIPLVVATQSKTSSSYASIVNLEGFSLEYVEATQDVASEIESCGQAIMCCVLGANPSLGVVEGYHQYAIDKVVAARKGLYLVRFGTMIDRDEVLKKGIYYFDQNPFIVKAWNEHLDLDISAITSLPIWVQFPELDVNLSKLRNLLGIPLKTDKQTMEKTYLNYARLLIDIPFEGPFPEYVDYINDKEKRNAERKSTQDKNGEFRQDKEVGVNQHNRQAEFITPRRTAQQIIHCAIAHPGTQKQFHITFVYGYNRVEQRRPLWLTLREINQ
ncbi:hypothetical protein Cgig2_024571 [Carnegiea gigantea]|uniref:DUF4283 domain-containing protein n=1 Tax=Carnegiea gigantea TaxID=171969 RepID=A0A9Q1GJB5_9CARY|nr:hypothetical protein Cgig2_024571 [Carnegiea gigantea]